MMTYLNTPTLFPQCRINLILLITFLMYNKPTSCDCPKELKQINCICFSSRVSCTTRYPNIKVSNITKALSSSKQSSTISELTIQNIINPLLTQNVFMDLTHLESLNLISIQLRDIEQNVFQPLKKLRILDLSRNLLHVIADYTFQGLNLAYLHMQENRNLRLRDKSFAGLRTTSLELKMCDLNSLSFNTMSPLNDSLKDINLIDNKITEFEENMAPMFRAFENINLEGNPFKCSCKLEWLINILKNAPKESYMTSSVGTKCATPLSLAGRNLDTLKKSELECELPYIQAAKIQLNIDHNQNFSGFLECSLQDLPSPQITWSRVHSNYLGTGQTLITNILNKSTDQQIGDYSQKSLVTGIHIKPILPVDTFICAAKNSAGETTITFKIHWPPSLPVKQSNADILQKIVGKTEINSASETRTYSKEQIYSDKTITLRSNKNDKYGGIFEKHFTVIELIGAIAGTFVATIVLFLLFANFVSFLRKEKQIRKKLKHQQNLLISSTPDELLSQYQQRHLPPGWTSTCAPTHDSSGGATYYAVSSNASHEYDVPRITDNDHNVNPVPTYAHTPDIQNKYPTILLPSDFSYPTAPMMQRFEHYPRSSIPTSVIDFRYPQNYHVT